MLIDGILAFISRINFMLSRIEPEKVLRLQGLVLKAQDKFSIDKAQIRPENQAILAVCGF